MQTLEAIRKRCSLRAHLCDKPVEPEKIEAVLEAARLAPSARNSQPWRFVVVQGRDAVRELVRGAFMGPGSIIELAPVIIVGCARPDDDVTHDEKPYYLFDMGMAMQNMLLAATDLGLVTAVVTERGVLDPREAAGLAEDLELSPLLIEAE